MDGFNPFANAWGDDNGAASGGASHGFSLDAPTSRVDDSLPSWTGASTDTTRTDLHQGIDVHAWDAPSSSSMASPALEEERVRGAANDAGWASEDDAPFPPRQSAHRSWSPKLDAVDRSWSPPREEPVDLSYAQPGEGDDTTALPSEQQEDLDEYGAFGSGTTIDEDADHSAAVERRDSGDAWGATELPPSAWEERLHAKPVWKDSATEDEAGRGGWGGATEELDLPSHVPPEDEETRDDTEYDTNSASVISPRNVPHVQKTDDELAEIRRLQEEYGIQIRNLDEEPSNHNNSSSPAQAQAQVALANAKAQVQTGIQAASSRWSIFSNKMKPAEEQVSGNMRSITTGIPAAVSPRQSTSSATTSEPPMTPASPGTGKQGAKDGQPQAQEQVGSRWFRFGGKGRNITNGTEADKAGTTSNAAASSSVTPAIQPDKPTIDLAALDDFGQLENFDSKAQASGSTPATKSVYDDLGLGASSDDPAAARKSSWSLWGRAGPMSDGSGGLGGTVNAGKGKHAALGRDGGVVGGVNDDDDFEGLDEAFSAPPAPSGAGAGVPEGANNRSIPTSNGRRSNNGLDQRFGALSMANMASTIRSSSSFDTFDPLDPLAEMSKSENRLPAQVPGPLSPYYRDQPAVGVKRSASTSSNTSSVTRSISPFPPRAPLAGESARPCAVSIIQGTDVHAPAPVRTPLAPPPVSYTATPSPPPLHHPQLHSVIGPTVVRMASNPPSRPGSTGPPPPLLAPPPSFGRKGSPSLLDEFGDFTAPPATVKPISSPNSVATASTLSAPPKVPSVLPPPASSATFGTSSIAADDDDFGDFADFTTASSHSSGFSPQKPNKANGPMKLSTPASNKLGGMLLPSKELDRGNKRSGTSLSNDDLSFFDSL